MGCTSRKGVKHEYYRKTKSGKNTKGAACSVVAKTGIATSTYDNIESGRTKSPETLTLKKIAEALDMDFIYLTSLIGKKDEEISL